ncbi:translocon at inner membrane of chloroplasts 21 [Actinidia rufa]|uniref:Translocon at inner membrane of chloroplasts 21 n=1 Tax=Actinidia rufa TaxID=165716 RepID=A0A7J0ESY6_9ERIC|nr:translocon at inner membrane of chloroplasts 21 [Actinidia rufa]
MQALLSPAARPGGAPPSPSLSAAAKPSPPYLHRLLRSTPSFNHGPRLPPLSSFSLSSLKPLHSLSLLIKFSIFVSHRGIVAFEVEIALSSLRQVSKRLESTSRYFKRLGSFGFWGQLVCTVVAAVILSFSVVVTGKITSPATFYATAGGIAAGFVSVFWSFGYIRLSDKLRRTVNEPSKAPPRADVVKKLEKWHSIEPSGYGCCCPCPVLALDVFLVQASANTILSHFLGIASSLELLRSVTLPPSDSTPIPRIA